MLDNNKRPVSPKQGLVGPRHVDEIDGGYHIPGSPSFTRSPSPKSLRKSVRRTLPFTQVSNVGQHPNVLPHSAFLNDSPDDHLVTHTRDDPDDLHPTAQNGGDQPLHSAAVPSQSIAGQNHHLEQRHPQESFQRSQTIQSIDYDQLEYQSLSSLFHTNFNEPLSYADLRFSNTGGLYSDSPHSPFSRGFPILFPGGNMIPIGGDQHKETISVGHQDARSQYAYRPQANASMNRDWAGGDVHLFPPTEMAVHSTPSSSDKPGHDPPEKRMSAEASHSRQREIRRGEPLNRLSSEYPSYLTGPSSPTEWDDFLPSFNGDGQRHLDIAGPDAGHENHSSVSGQSSDIDIQTRGSPQHIPMTGAANESPVEKTFLDCLMRISNTGPLPAMDSIRETIRTSLSQKYESDPQLNRYLLQVDSIIARFKPTVGSPAIRTDRNKVKKHETTHSCPVIGCTGEFTRKNGLKNHLGAHFTLVPALCPKCGKGFSASSSKRHIANCKSKHCG